MVEIFSNLFKAVGLTELPLWDHSMASVQWGAVLGASLVAATTDLRSRRIPNWLTLPLWVSGLVWAMGVGGFAGLAEGFAGCVLLAAPFVLLFVFAGGGAGDAKLMGAIGAWLGVANGIIALAAVLVAGTIIGLGMAATRGRLMPVLRRVVESFSGLAAAMRFGMVRDAEKSRGDEDGDPLVMPYGVSICTGVLAAALGVLV